MKKMIHVQHYKILFKYNFKAAIQILSIEIFNLEKEVSFDVMVSLNNFPQTPMWSSKTSQYTSPGYHFQYEHVKLISKD